MTQLSLLEAEWDDPLNSSPRANACAAWGHMFVYPLTFQVAGGEGVGYLGTHMCVPPNLHECLSHRSGNGVTDSAMMVGADLERSSSVVKIVLILSSCIVLKVKS